MCIVHKSRYLLLLEKKQLSKLEIDSARQLSQVRIHVERVIGLVRQKYSILQSTVSINMIKSNDDGISPIDKIVVICCALCNCCTILNIYIIVYILVTVCIVEIYV